MAHGGGPRQVKLDRESELRIEVGYDAPLKLRLLSGTAEIFGTELPPDFWLTFPPRLKFAVFTWNGATVEMEGSTETEYTADETPNISYVNVHAVLEERRHRAKPLLPDDPNSQINANLSICFKKCHSSPTYRHVAAGCTPADTCPNPSRPRRQTPRKRDRVVAGLVHPVHCGEVADCEVEVSKVADEVRSLSNLLGFLGSIGWQHICNSVQVFGFELSIE